MKTSKIDKLFGYAVIVGLLLLSCVGKIQVDKTYINGNIFNGKTFERIDFSIKQGQFIIGKNVETDSIIDLNGQYVIPPFGDAHTHNLLSLYDLEKMSKKYIDEGVFYIQVLGGTHKGRVEVESKLNDSVLEVKYSNGGITSTLGHPFSIAEPLAMRIHNPNEKRKRGDEIRKSRIAENDAYWFFDSKDDVSAKWQNLMHTKPDVIKIMLFDAKNYDIQNKDTLTLGKKGLSKIVAEYTIQKAKKDNLRVFAHIETADDFRLAVSLGVDVIAHIPGYSWRGDDESLKKFTLTKEDIQKASQRNVKVITTASLSLQYLREYIDGKPQINKDKFLKVIAFQKDQIYMLVTNGIDVTLGADQYQKTVINEMDYLNRYKILVPKTILDISTRVNSQMIFPNRKIGEIKDSFEASFLVLKNNPLEDFNAIKTIQMRVKNGKNL